MLIKSGMMNLLAVISRICFEGVCTGLLTWHLWQKLGAFITAFMIIPKTLDFVTRTKAMLERFITLLYQRNERRSNKVLIPKPNPDVDDVILWMIGVIITDKILNPQKAASQISEVFGAEFVSRDKQGNLRIAPLVQNKFIKQTKAMVAWDRKYRCWRLRDIVITQTRQARRRS